MKKRILVAGLTIIALTLAGCAGTGRVERDYGTSQRLSVYNQVLNLEAEKNLAPVEGMDGRAANSNVERYEKGFEKPQPAPTYAITVGGVGQ